MQATIFGATGMVGIEVLYACLDDNRIDSVTTVGRRKTGVQHEKIREIEHQDFLNVDGLSDTLSETDICFYCVGVYQGMVSTEMFWEITCSFFDAILDVIKRVRPDMILCLFSAQGADPTEASRFLLAKAKGRAETRLMDSVLGRKYIFRPGYINPGHKAARARVPSWLVKPSYILMPTIGIDAPDLARVMIHVGAEGSPSMVFENSDLRTVARRLRG